MAFPGSPHRPLTAATIGPRLAATAAVTAAVAAAPVAALVAAAALAAPAGALPRQVILLRHGDKVAAGDGNYNLSAIGLLRAINLGRLIPGCFGAPTHIRTFFLNPDTSKNARSYQSAVPLGVATGINISISQASLEDSFMDGQDILRKPAYKGGNLVLFWEHRRMPDLARGLGWTAMPAIGAMDFDQIFVLRYTKTGVPPQVESLSQHKLFEAPCFREARSPLPAVALPAVSLPR